MNSLPMSGGLYQTMQLIASNLDVIESFHHDMYYHDQRFVLSREPSVVLWGIGDCGTHLVDMSPGLDHTSSDLYNALAECYGRYSWFVIDTRYGRIRSWDITKASYSELLETCD